ncbi:MAG TPA: Fe-S protein assembly co-chaperone HscB [Terriglobales bacterium]|nr:Fe-S protein assembly co-chaperone HscB [Terriglobales bacterium]
MATEATNPKSHGLRHGCWSCKNQVEAHFCESCGKVQPAEPVDYFRFFGLSRKLDLNVKELERDFYKLSRQLHPDKYASVSDQERQWSLEKSARLNDAYRTLRDPIERTKYLLELEGMKLEEQSSAATQEAKAAGTEKKQVVPPELLEEVFELNMQLEEVRMAKKSGAGNVQLALELREHKEKFDAMLGELERELAGYWREWDAADREDKAKRDEVKQKMVDLLNRRSYIRNLVRDVNEALED